MNIIQQNYNILLKNLICENFTHNLKQQLNNIGNDSNVMNYINILSNLDESLCKIARESLVTIFETMVLSYLNSHERKSKYDIKSHHPRTILTIFGEITFFRTFYTSNLNGKNYCYVDRILGLHKHDYFDPYLKALIIEYAANNSYPKVAKYINDLIANRVTIKDKIKYVSRQTVRNIIMSANFSLVINDPLQTPEEIHIIADEKWIHTQNNNKQDVMQKSIVLFESISNHKLLHKKVFASLDNSFLHDCIDYIYDSYDLNKLKRIYIMGDGAKWIKNLANYFQFDNSIKNTPHREETITNKKEYILNNWKFINN